MIILSSRNHDFLWYYHQKITIFNDFIITNHDVWWLWFYHRSWFLMIFMIFAKVPKIRGFQDPRFIWFWMMGEEKKRWADLLFTSRCRKTADLFLLLWSAAVILQLGTACFHELSVDVHRFFICGPQKTQLRNRRTEQSTNPLGWEKAKKRRIFMIIMKSLRNS